MIQAYNISCGVTHKSWSQRIEKDQYRKVYKFETKWPLHYYKLVWVRSDMCIYSMKFRFTHI